MHQYGGQVQCTNRKQAKKGVGREEGNRKEEDTCAHCQMQHATVRMHNYQRMVEWLSGLQICGNGATKGENDRVCMLIPGSAAYANAFLEPTGDVPYCVLMLPFSNNGSRSTTMCPSFTGRDTL